MDVGFSGFTVGFDYCHEFLLVDVKSDVMNWKRNASSALGTMFCQMEGNISASVDR